MKLDWVQSPTDPGAYVCSTPWGEAVVKPTRGYPRSRKYRALWKGKDVERFLPDAIAARQFMENYIREHVMAKAEGFF